MRTKRPNPAVILWLIALVMAGSISAAPVSAQTPENLPVLDGPTRRAIVDSVTTALVEGYIFLDKAEQMRDLARRQLSKGAYDELSSPVDFASRLTEDFQSVSHDRHLTVAAQPPIAEGTTDGVSEEERARFYKWENYGFEKVERLPGNIGYLKLNSFRPAELGGRTAVAAMNLLAESYALIIDLRENGGGEPSMIQLISSYFFAEPKHLNSFYRRATDSWEQFWTQAHVDGPKMVDTPIWVLTSGYTFSGAEEFAYNLKNMKRATIVGETTGGGAHPVRGVPFSFPGFSVILRLPYGRAVNPITNTNWEGTGVEPDIKVASDAALAIAQTEALNQIEKRDDLPPPIRQRLTWRREALEAEANPIQLSEAEMDQVVGTYGPRKVTRLGDALFYQRDGRPQSRLVPLGGDRFLISGIDYFRVRFERDATGKVVRLVGQYDDGHQDQNDRSGD